ncbi:putative ATP-grasp superfamily ATP-dependent carboligase [Halopolyspora algeriensis]|uniref:Putative ATP-grasp superfamily ATP-dependent carboligase n=1 Tax=Halopolyspora algeriensis TaxID=1500506 RepID=A0A368VT91_9ACTN|nr:carboxylate--amine ligase [Halopolyspora algeriensis]RCW44426.1 putative ATP-grasp superfamily ATP-dependent carboligase [Halopolyspora algeriensis]TQM55787.1 putative ATP-grasp superfamily ATP-dependent carboligase [Halopolyspora algeriensis]
MATHSGTSSSPGSTTCPSGAGFDTTAAAVVLKLDPNVFHHGGLGVIRSLGRLGVPVYGVHEDALAPAAHSRYLHGRWLWRPEAADPDRVLDGLARLAERIGHRSVLLPTDDAGAILLAEHADRLRPWFRLPALARDLPRIVAGKDSLHRLCEEWDLPRPLTVLTDSWGEMLSFAAQVGFPLVAKLAAPWRSPAASGVRSTTIVRGGQELSALRRACDRAGGAALMLQEYLPGGPGSDWFFHGYCAADSTCLPAFTGVKERSYPAQAGLTSLGRCADNPVLRRQATDVLARLSFRGIVDLDWRRDERDGQYKLLDFNPRIGAQFRLLRDRAGIDVAVAAYLDLTGQAVPDGDPVVGRRFLVENYDPIAAFGDWRSGRIGLKDWAASLRGVDESAWFARDDLAPFGLMCVRMGWRAVTRPFSRSARSPRRQQPAYRPGRAGDSRGAVMSPGGQAAPGTGGGNSCIRQFGKDLA